jgi:ribosomal protein S18 acetylase RimI-like enzyme
MIPIEFQTGANSKLLTMEGRRHLGVKIDKLPGRELARGIRARINSVIVAEKSAVADILEPTLPIRKEYVQRVTSENLADFAAIWKLYEDSFVQDERRDLRSHSEIFADPYYEMHAVKWGELVVGFIGVWNLQIDGQSWAFVEHMATHPAYRSRGIGKIVLNKIARDRNVVLEVERPEGTLPEDPKNRRIRFYEREGFYLNDQQSYPGFPQFNYLQPSYGEDRNPVPLYLMTRPGPIKDETQFEALKDQIYKIVYGLADGKLPQSDLENAPNIN